MAPEVSARCGESEGIEPGQGRPSLYVPPMAERSQPIDRKTVLLAILVVIVSAFALKYSLTVTLPLAFGVFLVCLFWPLQKAMAKVLPRGVAVVTNVLLFLAITTGFAVALWAIAKTTRAELEGQMDTIDHTIASVKEWAAGYGVDLGGGGDTTDMARRLGKSAIDLIGGFTLTTAFLGLGLYETRDYEAKLEKRTAREGWSGRVENIAAQMRRYFMVRTGIGAITGVACALGSLAIGLDLWWLWGVLNFLLNYIPTLGSIIGVVPPVLFALVQGGGDPMLPILAFSVVGGVQLVMGNWVDPLVQGKYLALSPLVVLLSVVFWGWVWGIVGALIGVPLTLLIVLLTREFQPTEWIAAFLADGSAGTESSEPA
ncbi:MAG: hypothetical protein CMN30_04610 [Sandaracinus sp.]|nr:hypothetical protein [Sandaracinus sp.]